VDTSQGDRATGGWERRKQPVVEITSCATILQMSHREILTAPKALAKQGLP